MVATRKPVTSHQETWLGVTSSSLGSVLVLAGDAEVELEGDESEAAGDEPVLEEGGPAAEGHGAGGQAQQHRPGGEEGQVDGGRKGARSVVVYL